MTGLGEGWVEAVIPARELDFASERGFVTRRTDQRAGTAVASPIVLTRAEDGLFYLTGRVNGTPVRFLIDTGATTMVLSKRDARRAGVASADGKPVPLTGVGGSVRARSVLLDKMILQNGRQIDGVDALVTDDDVLQKSLIGQDIISQTGRIVLDGERMILG